MDHSAAGRLAPEGTAVLFDLDGTLVDSEPNYYEAARLLLARRGIALSRQEHERYVGISTQETLADWRERYGLDGDLARLLAEQNAVYLELARVSTRVYPQMLAFVTALHGAGVPVAVASGSSPQTIDTILAGTGLDAYFPVRVSADEVARGKPAPDVFVEAARRLGAAPRDCVVLEDALPGVLAARAAGMRCLAIPYLKDHADDPGFRAAELLFRGGQAEFTAAAALSWLARDRTGIPSEGADPAFGTNG